MDSDFDNVLDGLCGTIPYFDVSSFTCKDSVPPKAQHVLASALFSKIVQDMELKFDMTTIYTTRNLPFSNGRNRW